MKAPRTGHDPGALPALDDAHQRIERGDVEGGLAALVELLAERRAASSAEQWAGLVSTARAHPLRETLHRDPFTYRCYAKPRGYSPDGVALDYVLRARELPTVSADPVARLHHWMTRGQAARALLFRRDWIAREVDRAAAQGESPARVFAAGAGHLRECDRMASFAQGRIARLVAFDCDSANLEVVRADYAERRVLTHQGTGERLLEGRALFGEMNIVYVAGWLERMPHAQALALVGALFSMVARGGTLLATQVLPGLREIAFLEAFMDWPLACRSRSQVHELVTSLPAGEVASWTYGESPESTLATLTVVRR